MASDETARPPPQIIRVPPPDGAVMPPRVMYPLSALFVVAAAVVVPLTTRAVAVALGASFLGTAALLAGLTWWYNGHYRRQRREYLEHSGVTGADPRSAAILAEWHGPSTALKPTTIRAALNRASDPPPPGARIVCLGMLDVPEVGDLFFEPEIITPTRSLGRRMVFVPIAAVVIAVWLLQKMRVLPDLHIQLSSFGYFLFMGVMISGVWVWRSMIRPTYIRLAPGVIQVLEYPYRKGKPVIRSYPLDAGTLAVVHGPVTGSKRTLRTLTLLRDDRTDKIELWQMQKRDQAVERAWQALLSTAPIPPLSDEDLVG